MTSQTRAMRPRWLPLVGGLAWLDTVDAAGGRCECAGWCGPGHRAVRCRAENRPYQPLHVIAPSTTNGRLVAVCRACHDRRAHGAGVGR